jgi:hypothetical protein
MRHGDPGLGRSETRPCEEPQTDTAWQRERALTRGLMEQIGSSANLNQAYKRVKANRGAPGVDGMTVDDLRPWIAENKDAMLTALLDGSYRPQPVRVVEIPKPGGGTPIGHPDGDRSSGPTGAASCAACGSSSASSPKGCGASCANTGSRRGKPASWPRQAEAGGAWPTRHKRR